MRCSQSTMNKKQAVMAYKRKQAKLLKERTPLALYYADRCQEQIERITNYKNTQ